MAVIISAILYKATSIDDVCRSVCPSVSPSFRPSVRLLYGGRLEYKVFCRQSYHGSYKPLSQIIARATPQSLISKHCTNHITKHRTKHRTKHPVRPGARAHTHTHTHIYIYIYAHIPTHTHTHTRTHKNCINHPIKSSYYTYLPQCNDFQNYLINVLEGYLYLLRPLGILLLVPQSSTYTSTSA